MNNQIEEIQNDLIAISRSPIMIDGLEHWSDVIAEELYAKSYRKTEDVAREIFEEIEKEIIAALKSNYRVKAKISARGEENCITYHIIEGKIAALRGIDDFLAELKKKYESEGAE